MFAYCLWIKKNEVFLMNCLNWQKLKGGWILPWQEVPNSANATDIFGTSSNVRCPSRGTRWCGRQNRPNVQRLLRKTDTSRSHPVRLRLLGVLEFGASKSWILEYSKWRTENHKHCKFWHEFFCTVSVYLWGSNKLKSYLITIFHVLFPPFR